MLAAASHSAKFKAANFASLSILWTRRAAFRTTPGGNCCPLRGLKASAFAIRVLLLSNEIKDLCALGVEHAAGTGRWIAMATSNFCGPQFVGMWRDVAWHRRLTDMIKSAPVDMDLRSP